MVRTSVLALALMALVAFGAWAIGRGGESAQERYDIRREGTLSVGDPAPDVALGTLEGGETRLLDHLCGRPLILIFGSYT